MIDEEKDARLKLLSHCTLPVGKHHPSIRVKDGFAIKYVVKEMRGREIERERERGIISFTSQRGKEVSDKQE